MPRCIVLIRSHEPLHEGWRKRSFSPAGPLLDSRVKVPGLRFDETYHPVQVLRRIGGGDDPPSASGFNYAAVGPAATYAVRVALDDEAAVERLRRDRHPEIVGVFADPAVSPFPSAYCGDAAIGATEDVARGLGVPALRRRLLLARTSGRIKRTEAPVVPSRFASTAPSPSIPVFTSGVPESDPCTWMPPVITNRAPITTMNPT